MGMQYSEFVEVYEELGGVSGRLEKVRILSVFLRKLKEKGESKWFYLLRGRVFADYDSSEFGISGQLVIKAIGKSFGISEGDIMKEVRRVGDLGEIAETFSEKRKQGTLFSGKLSVEKVFENLRKVAEIEGKGAVDKKMSLISELISQGSGKEVKYIVRTLLNDLRIGVADGVLRDSLASAFLSSEKEDIDLVEKAYDLRNDFSEVFNAVSLKGERARKKLKSLDLQPGRALKVMLPVKVTRIEEGFKICGVPLAVEHKYDGFRMLIHFDGKKYWLFTRRLEDVTKQFPDVVEAVKKGIKGKSFIVDAEIVGFDGETGKYRPFEAISQRIRRKYDIEKLMKELPVEINVFDILYHNGKSILSEPYNARRKILERIIKKKKMVIRPSFQLVVKDEEKAMEFYEEALRLGEEGIMMKNINAEYRSGRRIGYIVKLKPDVNDLDLVIVGAEYGTGKRAGWLTSYIVACENKGEFLEVGKVASGLKEKKEEGFSYGEMTELLKPLIMETKGGRVRVKPKVIVAVTYQNVQKSQSYDSGCALRFPRIINQRPDKKLDEIATLSEIKKEAGRERE